MTLGEFSALACALCWSIAVVLFRKAGDAMHPVALNFYKSIVGLLFIIPTVFFVEGAFFIPIEGRSFWILMVSGFLGIGVADAMVLKSLSLVGATRWAIIECLYSPIIIVLSILFLGESLTLWQLIGALLVLLSVALVTGRQAGERSRRELLFGYFMGVMGLLTMAIGILVVKPLFDTVSLWWVIELRLFSGVIGAFVTCLLFKERKEFFRSLLHSEKKWQIFLGSLFSTYFAMILWVAGFKYNQVSVAAVLNQTCTVFTVILAVWFLKEKLTIGKLVATILATGGVLLMTLL